MSKVICLHVSLVSTRIEVNGQQTTDNSQRSTVNSPHPDGSPLSVVYSLLTLFYQRDYTDYTENSS